MFIVKQNQTAQRKSRIAKGYEWFTSTGQSVNQQQPQAVAMPEPV